MKENYDNIVYWGYKHYGRRDIRSVFRYNRKDVTMMTFNNQKAVKWEYVDDTQYFKCFHKYDDEIICQEESFDATTDELGCPAQTIQSSLSSHEPTNSYPPSLYPPPPYPPPP